MAISIPRIICHEVNVLLCPDALQGPVALQYAKSAIDKGMNLDIQAGLALERGRYLEILQTEDRNEGLAAFAEKRDPVYVGK